MYEWIGEYLKNQNTNSTIDDWRGCHWYIDLFDTTLVREGFDVINNIIQNQLKMP